MFYPGANINIIRRLMKTDAAFHRGAEMSLSNTAQAAISGIRPLIVIRETFFSNFPASFCISFSFFGNEALPLQPN